MGICCPFLQAKKEAVLYFTCRLLETECLKAVYGCFQVCGCADRVHEEQGTGQVLQRAARSTAALSAPGLLPPETCPTHPQVPPASARKKCISFRAAARKSSFLWYKAWWLERFWFSLNAHPFVGIWFQHVEAFCLCHFTPHASIWSREFMVIILDTLHQSLHPNN